MLSKKLLGGLNAQINLELASAYTYLSMSAWFEAQNLPGMAAWMRKQAGEELGHAMKIFDFVNDRDAAVTLGAVAAPPVTFKGIKEVWARALAHEEKVSASINRLYTQATAEKDYAAAAMLQWFVTEQVEEEKTARQILEEVEKIGEHSTAIYFQDRHLGKRAEKKD
jgi:ferritin